MAGIKIKSGHAVTNTLPAHSDGVQVSPANISFPGGGGMTDSMAHANPSMKANLPGGAMQKKNSTFPPAR